MEKSFQQSLLQPSIVASSDLSLPWLFKFTISTRNMKRNTPRNRFPAISCCSESNSSPSSSQSVISTANSNGTAPLLIRKRKRYRKLYPGESKGITEEMRFVAMRLRNINGKKCSPSDDSGSDGESAGEEREEGDSAQSLEGGESFRNGEAGSWKPSMEGFLKYLVDSKLVFDTVERIVDESNDVAYAYFRKTGLERSQGLMKDLEWFSQQNLVIPEPSNPGVSYANYLEELAEKSAPLFLCHFYNIYFAHIAGGQVIARQASEKLLDGRELEFYTWEGDVQESFKAVREKLNLVGEHWSREHKAKCLKEAGKAFKFLGQIVRLIIL
ncbi:hypothetical protein SLA2020_207350 [Shorea laevis]